ncbi:glycosyltransferase family A protein [Epilithonimonas hungarica]|uniref:Glycosyltransferase involved in cell wall bisynthesis n=1 Tax=Epilithonimonas hungarica TaxID=454006 RepID=A0A1G7FKE2_9FLAO|nr:glycosyltransferase family 2 protein [Epilithonimonas hungarica]MDP9957188.1 glycosyltransferase involved in cell wall biosynthesis [Epilithonimonas hungarica]SDE76300.1 Glycosyltransferase involved in cell wall bisynthesis [Epilithonimonas hungarica]
MNRPTVTILTPSYNRAHTLPRVFDSLQKQTFKDFEWIVIDDGSTDNTKEVISDFQKLSDFKIRYYNQENQHKFLTFFRGIDLAEGKYFSPLDSDDALPEDSIEILVNTWKNISESQNIVFVSSLCEDQFGNLVGDKFPKEPLVCSIFDMRYVYKVKGDKWGMGKTEIYKKMKLNFEDLAGKGFIPEGVFQYQFDKLGLHYCINKVCRIYFRDKNDELSLANQFYDEKNAFGLAENYKAFLNTYHQKFALHPKTLLRNLGGYLKFSKLDGRPYKKTINELDSKPLRLISKIVYPFSKMLF